MPRGIIPGGLARVNILGFLEGVGLFLPIRLSSEVILQTTPLKPAQLICTGTRWTEALSSEAASSSRETTSAGKGNGDISPSLKNVKGEEEWLCLSCMRTTYAFCVASTGNTYTELCYPTPRKSPHLYPHTVMRSKKMRSKPCTSFRTI